MANKKHNDLEGKNQHKENEQNEDKDKSGVENKAFEADDKAGGKTSKQATMNTNDKDNINQAQIEMGITESMICASKTGNAT